jgi:hypothetical protein
MEEMVMDLRFTAEELAFRDELRAFIRDHLPDDIRERMRLGYAPRKEDTVRWQHRPFPGSANEDPPESE